MHQIKLKLDFVTLGKNYLLNFSTMSDGNISKMNSAHDHQMGLGLCYVNRNTNESAS